MWIEACVSGGVTFKHASTCDLESDQTLSARRALQLGCGHHFRDIMDRSLDGAHV